MNATSSVLGTTLTANDLMLTVTEEYECHVMMSKNGKKDENVTFSANDSKGKSKKTIECFNCGKKGHKKPDCWAVGGGKEGQGPNQKGKGKAKEAANTVKEKSNLKEEEKEEAWMATVKVNVADFKDEGLDVFAGLADDELPSTSSEGDPASDSTDFDDLFEDSDSLSDTTDSSGTTDDGMPALQQVPDSSNEEDDMPCLQEVLDSSDEEDEEFDDLEFTNTPFPTPDTIKNSEDAYTRTFDYAFLTESKREQLLEVELYDSGASRHMSGYRNRFINFQTIPPKPITAADKRLFNAIGKGDMYVNIPNGTTTS